MEYPVIGVTAYNGSQAQGLPAVLLLRAYVQAVLQGGGAPILLAPELARDAWRSIYGKLDGILFTGGGDIAIERFDGAAHPRVDGVDPLRDTLEIDMLQAAVQDGKPFLCICRGIQVMNVGLGGTLYTHIQDQMPGALKHDYYPDIPRNYLAHMVDVKTGTRLAEILGEPKPQVNSLHHQGLDRIAAALVTSAFAPDGLVEAVELPEHPYAIGVQWHPEWITDQPAMQRLFRSFVEAAEKL